MLKQLVDDAAVDEQPLLMRLIGRPNDGLNRHHRSPPLSPCGVARQHPLYASHRISREKLARAIRRQLLEKMESAVGQPVIAAEQQLFQHLLVRVQQVSTQKSLGALKVPG